MNMKTFRFSASISMILSATGLQAQDLEKCFITPVDQVGFIETFTTPEECLAACTETEGCDSWNFLPHSFDSAMPGQCKLIKGIFSQEASDRSFCGKL